MKQKIKGTNMERELVHLLWDSGWAAVRVAGSGSSKYPSPDIIAGKGGRIIAIECKSIISGSKYLTKREVHELKEFCEMIGAEPWIGIRYSGDEWKFLTIDDLNNSPLHYVVNESILKNKGLVLKDILQ